MSQATGLVRESHTYKVIAGQELQLDVIGSRLGETSPCVIWIHGGGLIFGTRKSSPRDSLLSALSAQGLVVVTIDHRLAPEVKLPDILEDVRDAWHWVHDTAAQLGVAIESCDQRGVSSGCP